MKEKTYRYMIETGIVFDEREKILIGEGMDTDRLEPLENAFTLVRSMIDGEKIVFTRLFGSSGELEESSYLPSGVLAGWNVEETVCELMNITNLPLDDDDTASDLLIRVMMLERERERQRLLELERSNAVIRSTFENAKNTLLELSLFVDHHKIPLHYMDFAFDVMYGGVSTVTLKSGETLRQKIPASSLNLSAVGLYFDLSRNEEYSLDDRIVVEVVGEESGQTIAVWEVPGPHLEEKMLFELTSPYIASKETVSLVVRNVSGQDVELKLSGSTLFSQLWLDKGGEVIESPLALDLYKTHQRFSHVSAPYLSRYDREFVEGVSKFLSLNILRKIEILGREDVEYGKDVVVSEQEDRIRLKVMKELCARVEKAFRGSSGGLKVFLSLEEGEVDVGIFAFPHGSFDKEREEPIDSRFLKKNVEYFSGWTRGEKDDEMKIVSLFGQFEQDEIYDIVLCFANRSKSGESVVNIHNIEIIPDDGQ